MPRADGAGDLELKDEQRGKVEHRRPDHGVVGLQYAGRDDRRDGIGGVVKAVHEVEREGDRDQHDDYGEAEGNRLHASLAGRCKIPFALKAKPANNYECSRTMPSTMFATSSQRSVMSSRSS